LIMAQMTPSTLQYGMDGERPYGLYYRHSGHTPIASLLLAGTLGMAAGVAMALVYAYLIEVVPFIKLRFLATMGFGAAVGAVTAAIARAARCAAPASCWPWSAWSRSSRTTSPGCSG
jgi:MFS family permease